MSLGKMWGFKHAFYSSSELWPKETNVESTLM